MGIKHWLAVALALALALVTSTAGARYYATTPTQGGFDTSATLLGDGFTFVTLKDLTEAQKAPVTLIFYFSATCPHCIDAAPSIARLSKRLETQGVTTIGVASGRNTPEQLAAFSKTFGITFPMYRDASAAFARDNDIRSTPTVILLKKDGAHQRFEGLGEAMEELVAISAVKLAGGDALAQLKTDRYSGDRTCAACHVEEHRSWSLTHHAVAYYSLKGEEQRADEKCVGCHVTGWKKPTGYESFPKDMALIHVGCENCHGMAGGHGQARPPKTDLSAMYGPTCMACHDKKHSIGFTVEKGLPLIVHGLNRDVDAATFRQKRSDLERGLVDRPLTAFPEGNIAGSAACAPCHGEIAKGHEKSAHANAMKTLEKKDATQKTECLSCHALLKDPDKKGEAAAYLPGVGCESCHGPGEAHIKAKGGTDNIVGLTESCPVCVIEAMCTNCHTQEWDPEFDLEKDLPKAGHKAHP